MTREVWLQPNRRLLLVGIVGVLTACFGFWGAVIFAAFTQRPLIAGLLALPALGLLWGLGSLIYAYYRPVIAYEPGELLVYFKTGAAHRLPIDIVECFFLGQGPSFLPPVNGKETDTQNIIIRLAEAAEEWKHRDLPADEAHWCESYITLRGAWCEPITKERLLALNRRLVEVQREHKAGGR